VIKDLGDHPEGGGKVQVLSGRYGPYVKHGKINATLPRDRAPEEVTMEEAVELIAARAAKGPAKKKAKAPAKAKAAAKPKASAKGKAPAKGKGTSKTNKDKEAVEETAG
jgi:DNA topoisomerase-1